MTDLVPPAGRRSGIVLPRQSRPGEWCPLFSERIEVIPRQEWSDWIGRITLRPMVRQILDQDGVGSCTSEATSQGIMIVREMAGLPFELLNPWSIYRVVSGGVDRGSSIDENLRFARDIGVLPESYWPRSKGWRAIPPDGWGEIAAQFKIDEFYDIGSVDEFGTALLKGFPVIFGIPGHAICGDAVLNQDLLEYANSWHESWGDQGFGRTSWARIQWSYGAFCVRTTRTQSGTIPAEGQD